MAHYMKLMERKQQAEAKTCAVEQENQAQKTMTALKREQLRQQKELEKQRKPGARRTACAEKTAKRKQSTSKRRFTSSPTAAPAHKRRKDGPYSEMEGSQQAAEVLASLANG